MSVSRVSVTIALSQFATSLQNLVRRRLTGPWPRTCVSIRNALGHDVRKKLLACPIVIACMAGFAGGGALTLQLLPPDGENRVSVSIASINPDGIANRFDTVFALLGQESGIVRSARLDRGPSVNDEQTGETPDDPVITGS